MAHLGKQRLCLHAVVLNPATLEPDLFIPPVSLQSYHYRIISSPGPFSLTRGIGALMGFKPSLDLRELANLSPFLETTVT